MRSERPSFCPTTVGETQPDRRALSAVSDVAVREHPWFLNAALPDKVPAASARGTAARRRFLPGSACWYLKGSGAKSSRPHMRELVARGACLCVGSAALQLLGASLAPSEACWLQARSQCAKADAFYRRSCPPALGGHPARRPPSHY